MDFIESLLGGGSGSTASTPADDRSNIDEGNETTLINFGSGSQGVSTPQTLTANETNPAAASGSSSSSSGGSSMGSIMSIIGIVAMLL